MSDIVLAKVEDEETELFPPLGLMYLSDALEKQGISNEIWHGRDVGDFESFIDGENPDICGFTTLTAPMLKPTIRATKIAHEKGIETVWGGVHATIMPEECLNLDYVDHVVVREGEEVLPRLCKGEVDGLVKAPFVGNLDRYRPKWSKIDENIDGYFIEEHDFGERVLSTVTSRGCPYACGFCWNPAVQERRWRSHSVNWVVSEIDRMKRKFGIDGISFRDANFWTNIGRAREIVRRVDLPFYSGLRANYVDEDLVWFLEENKCKQIYVGAESGCPSTLEVINKRITREQIMRTAELFSFTDIETAFGFIIGFPNETGEELYESFKTGKEIAEMGENIKVGFHIYKPFPKTPLWSDVISNGFEMPEDMEEWAKFDGINHGEYCPWLDIPKLLLMRHIVQIQVEGVDYSGLKGVGQMLLVPLLKARWKWKKFDFPIEGKIIERILS